MPGSARNPDSDPDGVGSPVTVHQEVTVIGALINYRYRDLVRSVSAVPAVVSRFNNHRGADGARRNDGGHRGPGGRTLPLPPPPPPKSRRSESIGCRPTSRARRDANARTSGVRAGPLLAGR